MIGRKAPSARTVCWHCPTTMLSIRDAGTVTVSAPPCQAWADPASGLQLRFERCACRGITAGPQRAVEARRRKAGRDSTRPPMARSGAICSIGPK